MASLLKLSFAQFLETIHCLSLLFISHYQPLLNCAESESEAKKGFVNFGVPASFQQVCLCDCHCEGNEIVHD